MAHLILHSTGHSRESLPPELQSNLPSIEQIERELAGSDTLTEDDAQ